MEPVTAAGLEAWGLDGVRTWGHEDVGLRGDASAPSRNRLAACAVRPVLPHRGESKRCFSETASLEHKLPESSSAAPPQPRGLPLSESSTVMGRRMLPHQGQAPTGKLRLCTDESHRDLCLISEPVTGIRKMKHAGSGKFRNRRSFLLGRRLVSNEPGLPEGILVTCVGPRPVFGRQSRRRWLFWPSAKPEVAEPRQNVRSGFYTPSTGTPPPGDIRVRVSCTPRG